MEVYQTIKLANGIRVAYQHVPTTKIVHCGILLDTGSRDETTTNQGIAHFWEHMAFKGTRKRNALEIINSLEAVGGELNAFTDKEKVVFYASVRDQYFERAVDVLADITFHSVFPERQIKKERGVILEEMAMYLDNPDDSLQDEFEAVIYKNHPMGMKIIGRTETVSSFHRDDFLRFFRDQVDTGRIVFSCVGNIPFTRVEEVVQKYLNVKAAQRKARRKKFSGYRAREKELQRPVKQARCGMGRDGFSIQHVHRIPFYMLVNMLGGPALNSRLNLALREKYGFVYSVDAHYIPYTDTGMFAVFFGTEPKQLERCVKLVRRELDRFCQSKLTMRQLNAAREQIKGQLAMAEENNLSLMFMMGRSLLDQGRIPLLEEIYEQIDSVTPNQLRDISEERFDDRKLSYLKMVPNGNTHPQKA